MVSPPEIIVVAAIPVATTDLPIFFSIINLLFVISHTIINLGIAARIVIYYHKTLVLTSSKRILLMVFLLQFGYKNVLLEK